MVKNKSAFIVLIFSLLLSFGLLCSAASARRTEQDPRQQYEQCQKRCQWETRGERKQVQCEESCERQYKKQQQGPEDPQRKYEECQQLCEQQEFRQQPQCQRRCQRQFEEQQRQQQQCQERCERKEQGQGKHEQQQCQMKCQQKSEEQQREKEQQSQKQYQECQQRCQEQEQRQEEKQQCQRQCRELYEEQGRDDEDYHPHKQSRREEQEGEEEEEEEEEQQQRNNPYYFPHRESFQTRFRDEEGKFKVLQRFTEKSRLLKGIKDYRFAMFEANPHTFILPHHCDAEAVYFVTNGKGTITFVTHENKESYNVERGTVVRIPAGSTVYMVNQDKKEKLTIAVLAMPVNTPGKSEEFFPAGNENPQSYYQVFSHEILETVLNTQREKLDKLFEGQQRGQQKQKRQQGIFRRAKPEQIKAMSQQATSPRKKGGEKFAINLLSQSPVYSNQNGRFFEASPEEFKQLRNMDVSVAACKINQEAIFVPHYNSKATFVVFVTEGNGYIEMACPHLSRQSQRSQNRREQEEEEEEEEEQRPGEYKKVKARLSPGDIFVVPAGHPVTFVASKNQNLKIIGFGINAQNNQRIFLAGKKNLMRQMDSEAKELSFGVPSKFVDEIFNNPKESYFMSSSQQRQRGSEESRGNPIASFLDFARLF